MGHFTTNSTAFRRPFTTAEAYKHGSTPATLRWQVRTGVITRVEQGVYVPGAEAPTQLERAIAIVMSTGGIASHTLAGLLHGLDSVTLTAPFVSVSTKSKRIEVCTRKVESVLVNGIPCTDGRQTLLDLAGVLDDSTWEHALESALRKQLTTIPALQAALEQRRRGNKRIRRVLAVRPPGAPPTESLLETLMVQLIRTQPSMPTPERQVVVLDQWDRFVARVDLAWPEHGIFLELDGQHHKDQPLYDANRQTAAVAATGWLPGRFTWHEVTLAPTPTLRRLVELLRRSSLLPTTA